jgi:hypothetical protein
LGGWVVGWLGGVVLKAISAKGEFASPFRPPSRPSHFDVGAKNVFERMANGVGKVTPAKLFCFRFRVLGGRAKASP